MELRMWAQRLNEGVMATKRDTDAGTNNLIEGNRIRNLVEKIKGEGYLVNFDKMVGEGTMINTYTENALHFTQEAFSSKLLSGAPIVQDTVEAVVDQLSMQDDEKSRAHVFNNIKAYLASSHPAFNISKEHKNRLLATMHDSVLKFKREFPDNPFGQILGVKADPVEKDGPRNEYVSTVPKKMDRLEEDRIWLAWEAMFDDNTSFNGDTVSNFAKDMLRYSYFNSGLMHNFNSFSRHIPNTILDKMGYFNMMQWTNEGLATQKGVMSEFVTQYARHYPDSVKFFRIGKETLSTHISAPNGQRTGAVVDPSTQVGDTFKHANMIYRYVGTNDKGRVYQAHSLLGVPDSKKRTFVEYAKGTYAESVYRLNIAPINIEVEMDTVETSQTVEIVNEADKMYIRGLEEHELTIDKIEKVVDNKLLEGYIMKLDGDTVGADFYLNKDNAINGGTNVLKAIGFDLLSDTLNNKC